jgi:hypothetical protein
VNDVVSDIKTSAVSGDEKDVRQFWVIVGLLESGYVTDAEALLRKYHPSDTRLLLAIHLGCFLIQHVRVSTEEQRKAARRICERVAPYIASLSHEVLKEFKTQLLELRRGELVAIPESHRVDSTSRDDGVE